MTHLTYARLHPTRLTGALAAFAALALAAPAANAQTVLFTTDRGFYNADGGHNSDDANYRVGSDEGNTYRNFFVFDIPALGAGQQYTAASFTFNTFFVDSPQNSERLALSDYTGSIGALTGGTGRLTAYNDLGSGVTYGTITITTNQSNQFATVTFTSRGLAAINGAAGGQFAFGGSLTTLSNTNAQEIIAAFGGSGDPSDGNTYLTLRSGPSVAVIPEPSEWATGGLIAATLVLGMVRARRRKAAPSATTAA